MVIATSTGEIFESEEHMAVGEAMPSEGIAQITVRPYATASEETQSTPPVTSEYGDLKEAEQGMEREAVGQHPEFDTLRNGRSAPRWDGHSPNVFEQDIMPPKPFEEKDHVRMAGMDKFSAEEDYDPSQTASAEPFERVNPNEPVKEVRVRRYGADKITAEEFKRMEFADKARYIGAMAYEDTKKLVEGIAHALKQGPEFLEKVAKGEIDPHSDEAVKEVTEIAMNFGIGGLVTSPLRPKGSVGMFGGKLGVETAAYAEKNPAMKAFFDQGIKELNAGVDPIKVYERYGIFEGPDGKFRFEISDKGARLKTENMIEKPPAEKPGWLSADTRIDNSPIYETPFAKPVIPEKETTAEWMARLKDESKAKFIGPKTIGDILDHPELYKYYPDVANIKLADSPWHDFWGSIRGFHDPEKNIINIRGSDAKNMLSTALHEVQHAIQHREGFARGGNSQEFIPTSEAFTKVKNLTSELNDVMRKHHEAIYPEIQTFVKKYEEEQLAKYKKFVDEKGVANASLKNFGEPLTLLNPTSFTLEHLAQKIVEQKPLLKMETSLWDIVKTMHPDYAENLITMKTAQNTLNQIEARAFESYKQLWGEYEARVTQARQAFDSTERRQAPHWLSEEFAKTYPDGTVPFESIKVNKKP